MPTPIKTIGFISPPDWIDPSPDEFRTLCVDDIRTRQCALSLPGFDWRIESIAATEPEMTAAARELGESGCDAVAKVGTPFAWAGCGSFAEARARQARLADAARVPVVMTGLAILEAFRALGAEKVALACTYYSDDWMARWSDFIHASGFEVVAARNLSGQGLMPPHDIDDKDYWAPSAKQISMSVKGIAEAAPAAQAIAVSGAGSRTLALIADLEARTGLPVFGSDTALYWALAKVLDIRLQPGMLGRLAAY